MYNRKVEEDLDCGIRVAFKIFGGKWKLCIIDAINKGIARPAELRKSIVDATPRVIEMQLAELLAYGVVQKCTSPSYPKRSVYELTSFGKSILPVLSYIDKWGTAHSSYVKMMHEELVESGV
jgi:DNA-binding HxlR family transcriptional regulator